MLQETVRVVEVGSDYLKVVAQSKSACGKCVVQQGCGQGLLSRWGAKELTLILPLDGWKSEDFHAQDEVVVGVAETFLLRSVLILYMIPLLAMLLGVMIGHWWFDTNLGMVSFAVAGFLGGAQVARYLLRGKTNGAVLMGKVSCSNDGYQI